MKKLLIIPLLLVGCSQIKTAKTSNDTIVTITKQENAKVGEYNFVTKKLEPINGYQCSDSVDALIIDVFSCQTELTKFKTPPVDPKAKKESKAVTTKKK